MCVCVHINEVTCCVCVLLWKHTPEVTCDYYSDIIKKIVYMHTYSKAGRPENSSPRSSDSSLP